MLEVRRTPRAYADLAEIVAHISADSVPAALALLAGMEQVFELLATQPELGTRYRARRSKQTRRHSHGNYVIYYRPLADGVEIVRVLHGARDHRRLV